LIGAGLIVATGIRAREDSSTKLKEWTDAQAIPSVAVALPSGRALSPTIDLPGRLEAYSRAPIFARVSGYLKSWNADIGAKVRAGDVIAEIEAPDLDQQLLQARADLVSQQSSAQLSEATLTRRKSLLASNFVSMQEIDERTADLNNKKAAVKSGQANVERLEALAGYKKITVPFDGVVTSARGPRCSWYPTSPDSASMSTCRRTMCPRSRSARRLRWRCRNIRTARLRRRWRPPRSRSMYLPGRHACSSRSTMRPAN
jgi:multidrug efflux pump subunit AcrA (membrane-fusion protein)